MNMKAEVKTSVFDQWEKYMEDEKIKEFMDFCEETTRVSTQKTLEALDLGIMRISGELIHGDLWTVTALAPVLRDLAAARADLASQQGVSR